MRSRSMCVRVLVPTEGCEGEHLLNLSPWFIDNYLLFLHIVFSFYIAMSKCPIHMRTQAILG